MPRLHPVLIALVLLAGCGREAGEGSFASSSSSASEADSTACRVEARGIGLAGEVRESSGIAASRRHAGVLWTHGDSGNGAEVFAVRADGRLVGRVRVRGASNRDWEDMAVGACPGGGDCLYLADTGDNAARRPDVALWRVPEPAPGAGETAPAERIAARYPGGPRDAEALFILPGGAAYVVTKGDPRTPIELYRFPARSGGAMERVRQVLPAPGQPGDRVTGASASPGGRWVALRTYTTLLLFRADDLVRGGGPAITADLASLGESIGEGVSLGDDGTVVLSSEGAGERGPGGLARLRCALP